MNELLRRHAMRSSVVILSIALLLFVTSNRLSLGTPKLPEPISVGMVALLAAPEKYNGKLIRTWGFLNLRSDDDALFLHEEDLRVPLLKNSFRLELTVEQEKQFKDLNLTYVVIDGTLHSEGAAGPALNSGTIVHITLVNRWKPFVPFEPKAR
jgi:hypothetical protein